MSAVYDDIRAALKKISAVRGKLNGGMIIGNVKEVKGKKVRFTLYEQGVDGPVLSPWLRLGQPGGKNGGGHSQYVKPGIGEPMLIISPGGQLNEHSRAFAWGHVDDFDSPGEAEKDGFVHESGDAKFEVKNGAVKITVGSSSMTMTGSSIAFAGAEITHDGKKIDKTHKHKDVEAGGNVSGPPQ